MDDMPGDLRDLYVAYGQTAEMAQVLELEAGNFALAYCSLVFDPENLTLEDRYAFKALSDDVDRRTFGNRLKHIREVGTISESIETSLNDALGKRNYLTHKFFRAHNFAIHSEEGRKAMATELDEIYRTLSVAHSILSGMTHTFTEAFGRRNISKGEALELMKKAKKLEI
jgi:hypothetical protein